MSSGPDLQLPSGEFESAGQGTSTVTIRSLAEVERDHILYVLRQVRWVIGGRNGGGPRGWGCPVPA